MPSCVECITIPYELIVKAVLIEAATELRKKNFDFILNGCCRADIIYQNTEKFLVLRPFRNSLFLNAFCFYHSLKNNTFVI